MGSKRSNNYIARVYRHTSRKTIIQTVVYQVLNLIACYLYSLSLEGGDIDYVLSQVSFFVTVVLSSFTLVVVIAVCNFYTCTGVIRVMNFVIQFLVLGYSVTRDLGTDLMNHGQYNLLIYCLLTIPVFITFVICKGCFYAKKLMSWKK